MPLYRFARRTVQSDRDLQHTTGELRLLLFVLVPEGRGRRPRSGTGVGDESLLSRSREGDLEAFAELIREHEGRVYGIVCQYVKDEEDARDLTREVFYKAYRSLDRFKGSSRFSSWVCRIAINRSIDYLRRKKNVRFESLDEPIGTDDGEVERDIPDRAATPEGLVEQRELSAKIAEAIERLSPKLRAVTVLREYQGLSIEEISETLRVSEGTVKSRIFRARERLRELLASYVEGCDSYAE